MQEPSALDILIENLAKREVHCESSRSDKYFFTSGSDRMFASKYVLAAIDSCFFFASDSYGSKAYSSSTYSGVYTMVDLPTQAECNIYKKDPLDRFFRTHKQKTGDKYLNDKLTITSQSGWTPQVLKHSDVDLLLEIAEVLIPVKLIIQPNYLQFIDNLKDKTIVGLEADYWIYQDKDLDTILNKGIQLIKGIKEGIVS